MASQVGGESGPVEAGALHAEAEDLAERGRPLGWLLVAAAVGGDADRSLGSTDGIDGHGGVDVLVGIDPDDDFPDRLGLQDGGQGRWRALLANNPP